MPSRSPWRKRRILGFQRRVWWPKCTPASSSSLIPTRATLLTPFSLMYCNPTAVLANLAVRCLSGFGPEGQGATRADGPIDLDVLYIHITQVSLVGCVFCIEPPPF